MADINEDGGKRTVQSMPESMRFHKANVAQASDWKRLVEATLEAFGGIHCLVNNAGTTYRNKVMSACLHISHQCTPLYHPANVPYAHCSRR